MSTSPRNILVVGRNRLLNSAIVQHIEGRQWKGYSGLEIDAIKSQIKHHTPIYGIIIDIRILLNGEVEKLREIQDNHPGLKVVLFRDKNDDSVSPEPISLRSVVIKSHCPATILKALSKRPSSGGHKKTS